MNKIVITSKMLLICAALTIGFTSCNKNNITDETETAAAQNLNIAEVEDDNTQIMADQAESNGEISDLRTAFVDNSPVDLINGCAVITRDTLSTPKKITIDFGTGCTNANGVTRKGIIYITYTGRYRAEGTVIHIVSENYFVNENKVDIDRTVTNLGENINGNLTFGIHAERIVTFPDGTTSSSTIDKVREWITGANTPRDFTDDVYRVTGTGTHTSRRGMVYDATTLTPLIRKVVCHQFVSGEVKIVRNGNRTRFGIINFGAGECDNEATVTLDNGRVFTINLRH
jgi:hypothetical protein